MDKGNLYGRCEWALNTAPEGTRPGVGGHTMRGAYMIYMSDNDLAAAAAADEFDAWLAAVLHRAWAEGVADRASGYTLADNPYGGDA